MSYESPQPTDIHRTYLLNQYPGGVAIDLDLGRNDADLALREVGAISTTDRGRNASDWTATPNRRPTEALVEDPRWLSYGNFNPWRGRSS